MKTQKEIREEKEKECLIAIIEAIGLCIENEVKPNWKAIPDIYESMKSLKKDLLERHIEHMAKIGFSD